MSEIVPDHIHREAFVVRTGATEQSWVDLADPLRVEFEYVQRIVEILELGVLARPPGERLRCVHVGGGGLSIPRYVAARRPGTVQIVLEPDADLVEQVRDRLPLPKGSGIRIRPTDGRTGLAELSDGSADLVVVDAFDGAQVPADLATAECFARIAALLRPGGMVVMNLGDRSPFDWGRRCVAGVAASFGHIAVTAELPVWKGRRYGNLVVAAAGAPLPVDGWAQALARAAFGYRLFEGTRLRSWIGGAAPFTDADTRPSLDPVALGWLP
ncbi:spermidine synthase [Propionicicella superfundia]|uniref:spermidine synthase n=1 Tax=Propionicicella superfundia TaxID=348582 RepID=UPI0004157962|nr:fused MFS/spermidine synthase [Propionicicella superfundia]